MAGKFHYFAAKSGNSLFQGKIKVHSLLDLPLAIITLIPVGGRIWRGLIDMTNFGGLFNK